MKHFKNFIRSLIIVGLFVGIATMGLVQAADMVLEGTISDLVFKIDKNGNPYSRAIVQAEFELNGADRAAYGDKLLDRLADRLTELGVRTCDKRRLYQYLRFYNTYPGIVRSLTAQSQTLLLSDSARTLPEKPALRQIGMTNREQGIKSVPAHQRPRAVGGHGQLAKGISPVPESVGSADARSTGSALAGLPQVAG